MLAKRGERGGKVGTAGAEFAVRAFAVASAAPVEAHHGEALFGEARGKLRLSGKSA